MSKLPPLNLELEPVYLPYGRKSHPNEKKDQKHTEREQREGSLAWVKERTRRDRRGQVAVVPWLFDDETGLNAKRPKYQQRLAEARELRAQGRKVYFVVRILDRLGRDAEELHRAYKELLALDVELVAVDMGGTIAPEVFPYLVANAHVGSLKIAANVKRINDQFRRDGWWRPGRPTWGYASVPATPEQEAAGSPKAVLAIDDDQAGAVGTLFVRASKGEALSRLARWAAGLPERERGGYETKDGWHWRLLSKQALLDLLRSRTYIGQQPDGTRGNWPALVDADTWAKVQVALASTQTMQPQQASGEYLLTGRLWCPLCEGRGVAARMRGWGKNYEEKQPRYLCSSREMGARAPVACNFSVLAPSADGDVRRQLGPLLRVARTDRGLRRDVERALRDLLAQDERPKSNVAQRLAAVDAEIGDVRAKGDVLFEKLEARTITDAEFTRRMAPHREAEGRLQGLRAALAGEVEREHTTGEWRRLNVAGVLRHLDDWARAWASDDRPTQRGVLGELVERIVPERHADAQVTCHIVWTEHGQTLVAAAKALGLIADEGQEIPGDGQGEAAAG